MLIESCCKLAAFRRASKYRAGDRKIGCIQLWRNPAGASQRTQTNRNFLLRGTCQSGWLRKTFIQLSLCLLISTLYCAVYVNAFECPKHISTVDWTWSWPMWVQHMEKIKKKNKIILCHTRLHPTVVGLVKSKQHCSRHMLKRAYWNVCMSNNINIVNGLLFCSVLHTETLISATNTKRFKILWEMACTLVISISNPSAHL